MIQFEASELQWGEHPFGETGGKYDIDSKNVDANQPIDRLMQCVTYQHQFEQPNMADCVVDDAPIDSLYCVDACCGDRCKANSDAPMLDSSRRIARLTKFLRRFAAGAAQVAVIFVIVYSQQPDSVSPIVLLELYAALLIAIGIGARWLVLTQESQQLAQAELDRQNRQLQQEMDERQRAEAALLLYKSALDSSSDAIGISDPTGALFYQNAAYANLFGCETLEQFNRTGGIAACYLDAAGLQAVMQAMTHSQSWIGEVEQVSRNGRCFPASVRIDGLKDESGELIGWIGTITDITDRKQTEAQLREQEQFFRTLYEGVEHSIAIVDVLDGNEFRYVGWNPATEQRTGISAQSIVGKTPEELLGEASGAIVRQNYQRCLEAGTTIRYEEHLPIEGQDFWWLTTINPLKNSTGQIYRLVITAIPITDRKHAEIALQRSEQRFRSLVQNTAQIIWDTEAEGKFSTDQPAWSAFTGQSFEQLRGWGWLDAIHPDDQWHTATAWSSALTNVRHYKVEHRLRRHDGEYRHMSVQAIPILEANGSISEWIGVHTDIHDRKLAEEALRRSEAELRQQAADLENTLRELQQTQAQLVQTEKMSSLGQLVAGVAHEINNPVNFIHGNLSYVGEYTQNLLHLIALYQQHSPPHPQLQAATDAIDLGFIEQDLPKMLGSMRMGTDRIRTIVLALRNFSRMDEADKKRVNLHDGIDSTLLILQHRLKATGNRPEIIVVKDYGDLPPIECYAGQLNQVFMNILSNAIEALDDLALRSPEAIHRPPRQITIQTKRICQHIHICIRDNGLGMSESTRSRLFEPFFTTKAIGKGTGLGLSISYQVVARHGGKLSCISAPGEGAAFFLELPIA